MKYLTSLQTAQMLGVSKRYINQLCSSHQIAGAYNAWRNTLLFLISTISTYVTAVLLEKGLTTVVLVACAVGYSVGMILHKRMYYRFAETDR